MDMNRTLRQSLNALRLARARYSVYPSVTITQAKSSMSPELQRQKWASEMLPQTVMESGNSETGDHAWETLKDVELATGLAK